MSSNLPKLKAGFNYKYTELAQVNEYLESENIRYYQFIDTSENGDYIITVPIVDGKELPGRRGCKIVMPTTGKNLAQDQGSAITYARRYSLLMAFGLATEDDDAASVKTDPKQDAKPVEDDRKAWAAAKAACIKAITDAGTTIEACCRVYKVKSLDDMSLAKLENAAKHAKEIAAKDKEMKNEQN